jgi:hypothetical protein
MLPVFAALLLAGCGDEPTSPLVRPGVPTSTWQGSVVVTAAAASRAARRVAVGDQGTVLLDVRTAGADRLDGTLVMRWPGLTYPIVAPLSGTTTSSAVSLSTTGAGDTLAIALAPFGLTRLEGTLTGTLGGQDIAGNLVLDRIPAANLQAQTFLDLPQAATLSMAVHDDTLWLSTTSDDYLLVTLSGNLVDQIAVEYSPGTFWTSSVLASGSGKLWGHIVTSTGSSSSVSRVLPFRREGLLSGDFVLPHLSAGLTHDGTDLWSVDNDAQKLYRVTEAGAVVDSVAVANPDLYQLAWDGAHFWSMGWYLPLLWKIEPDGDVVGVFRLSASVTGTFPAGVASDGQYLYAARGDLGTTTIARLQLVTPVP